jgi:hypothetical protein
MKKLLFILLILSTATTLFAKDVVLLKSDGKSDKNVSLDNINNKLEGKAKLGLSLGYPTGITFGYQMTDLIELNTTIGLFDFNNLAAGVSTLFALFDFEAGEAVFPVTAGPAIYFHAAGDAKVDILAVIRIEYDFEDAPLNIYIEGGAGMRITPDTKMVGSGALGIRYVF